ncbi:hypothetical protein [Streptomyces sp. NPDC047000]|uniref:hypothetical protein n=1 Tax=Streptomyces sp. NPDC047000 TaxID=3155474 RepID=UPI0033FF7BDF
MTSRPRRPRALLPRTALAATAALLLVGLLPTTAEAHRDGCHRWHSCPSDTGSYVCGDLGYDTYCGGTADAGDAPTKSVDVTAPRQPNVARSHSGRGGKVSLTVTAEQGAHLEVAENDEYGDAGNTVAKATATGGAQTITFRAATGSHTYTVTATDSAGNVSDVSDEISLDVDADAPPLTGLSVTDPDTTTATAHLAFASAPGATYVATVVGRKDRVTGTVGADAEVTDAALVLPDGSYTVRVTVTDDTGNARQKERKLRVALGRLAPRVTADRARGSGAVAFTITAPPHSKGALTIGEAPEKRFTTDGSGLATVAVRLPDGRHPAPAVTVTDAYGRSGSAKGSPLIVDTAAPALKVIPDIDRASHGDLALTVATTPRTRVTVLYGHGIHEDFVSSGRTSTVTRALDPGTYHVKVTATDAYGNTSTKLLSVPVDDRRTPVEWLAVVLKSVVGLAVLMLAVVAHRRTRPAREAFKARQAAARYERDLGTWQREHDRLVGLAEFAAELGEEEHVDGGWQPSWGKRKRGESAWWLTGADLVQPARDGRGVDVRDSGTVIITAQRMLFIGGTRREWLFAKVEKIEHSGRDVTLIRVSNRTKLSGVRYRLAPEKTRIALDSAIAEAPPGTAPQLGTGRRPLLAGLRQAITTHDRSRPVAPHTPAPRPHVTAPSPSSSR